ncbi:MAG: ribbon-helix-helix domain-containing protein [Longimicrobiales bacterium]
MGKKVKTTVYLDDGEYRRLKHLAKSEGRSTAELIRAAVSEYADRHASPALPRSLGIGGSGDPDFAARSEELLEGFGSA